MKKERTYMKVATGGVNVGLGGKLFQQVFLFENQAAFGKFVNGMAVFQLTDKGLLLAADLTGTKYWKNSDLN